MPHVLVIRHAEADHPAGAEHGTWGDDRARPLSTNGEHAFRLFIRESRRYLPSPAKLWSSPLTRAWQTATILRDEAGWPEAARSAVLEPGISTPAVVSFLQQNSTYECVAIVGHEPDLHRVVACLTTGTVDKPVVAFGKGAIAQLFYERRIEPGSAVLRRLLLPPG